MEHCVIQYNDIHMVLIVSRWYYVSSHTNSRIFYISFLSFLSYPLVTLSCLFSPVSSLPFLLSRFFSLVSSLLFHVYHLNVLSLRRCMYIYFHIYVCIDIYIYIIHLYPFNIFMYYFNISNF